MGARILLIEDNKANLDLMLYLLRAFGHDAVGLADGLDGLAAAKAGGYQLVLTDMLMPGIDGYEVARRYRSDPNVVQVPLIAVTALAMVGDREKILAGGFDGYLAKPIDPETFVAQVESFLGMQSTSPGVSQGHGPAATALAQTGSSPLILVVDDLQVNIDVIASSLKPFGYRIAEAHNAREALEQAIETHPAMILCDLHMAGGNGFDFLHAIRSSDELHRIPFYFISSTVWQTTEKIQAYQLGADKFLVRPIDPASLRKEVEAALERSQRVDYPHR